MSNLVRQILEDRIGADTATTRWTEKTINEYAAGDPIPVGFLGTLIQINLFGEVTPLRAVRYDPPKEQILVKRIENDPETGKERLSEIPWAAEVIGMTPKGVFARDTLSGRLYLIEKK